jgi:hypothetical protein
LANSAIARFTVNPWGGPSSEASSSSKLPCLALQGLSVIAMLFNQIENLLGADPVLLGEIADFMVLVG